MSTLFPSDRSYWKSLKKFFGLNIIGLEMFLIALVGYLPSHTLRLFIYRRLFRVHIGKKSSIHWRAQFRSPRQLIIGNNSIIGDFAMLDARSGITIGENVNIAGEVAIFTLEHDPDHPMFEAKGGPVIIEDYVYIGSRVTILPDIRIGYGAVVATGAVVTHDIPPYHIVGGVPARFIRERSHDLRYELNFALPFQ